MGVKRVSAKAAGQKAVELVQRGMRSTHLPLAGRAVGKDGLYALKISFAYDAREHLDADDVQRVPLDLPPVSLTAVLPGHIPCRSPIAAHVINLPAGPDGIL
jgi:hypothetical protein